MPNDNTKCIEICIEMFLSITTQLFNISWSETTAGEIVNESKCLNIYHFICGNLH